MTVLHGIVKETFYLNMPPLKDEDGGGGGGVNVTIFVEGIMDTITMH